MYYSHSIQFLLSWYIMGVCVRPHYHRGFRQQLCWSDWYHIQCFCLMKWRLWIIERLSFVFISYLLGVFFLIWISCAFLF
ncbi:hypothetical protein P167DRAFT_308064 [Morchella conica CCBAS932]|uniref:Uncharacterized protein n=1 Tax=Morchella conica CCBAS932 TaxID=1392247 RepID=A0A3N4KFE7_9PEZI|nr:hypothetical protein P167DRAFT_308064 [Morchella conica CCBAS932]